ncbi:S-adenosyl-L-methionine-dependent methyltransferase [Cokeromyces recurvatus]|uniref:S-adenosyl-L-methionine-dependent methyltransferase n=1 Tax=Cokeromyces recurvatus TaxID=90255 RepID=UPI00221F6397|nr:S-adenosyl-L-methionine-dependent methyltransferase [Cokeromyces recurvatus]KAI7907709.1 S-adenosyl-L-methionine-dependent methyltransferase [Cokeromyces recurvatus]
MSVKENDPSIPNKFLQVYGDADNRIYDESAEDPFPAYIDDVDTSLAPFCPTSAKRVLKALNMVKIGSHDVLIDLGSGDGRFVTAAVSEFGASKAVGIESDEKLVETSKTLSKQILLPDEENKVSFILGDLLDLPKIVHDINWTVIIVFLLPDHTDKFADFLLKHYRNGARIVSLVFNLNEISELNLIASDEPDGIYVYGQ